MRPVAGSARLSRQCPAFGGSELFERLPQHPRRRVGASGASGRHPPSAVSGRKFRVAQIALSVATRYAGLPPMRTRRIWLGATEKPVLRIIETRS
jgi:hypothetical protein